MISTKQYEQCLEDLFTSGISFNGLDFISEVIAKHNIPVVDIPLVNIDARDFLVNKRAYGDIDFIDFSSYITRGVPTIKTIAAAPITLKSLDFWNIPNIPPILDNTKQKMHNLNDKAPAINNHICPTCKNNRCSKSESICWRCGNKL